MTMLYGYHILNQYVLYDVLSSILISMCHIRPGLLTIFTFFIQDYSTLGDLLLVLCMCEVFLITAFHMINLTIDYLKQPPLHVFLVFMPLLSKKKNWTDQVYSVLQIFVKTKMLHGLSAQLAFSNPSVCDGLSWWQPTGNDICRTHEYSPLCNITGRLHTGWSDLMMTLTLTSLSLSQQQSHI